MPLIVTVRVSAGENRQGLGLTVRPQRPRPLDRVPAQLELPRAAQSQVGDLQQPRELQGGRCKSARPPDSVAQQSADLAEISRRTTDTQVTAPPHRLPSLTTVKCGTPFTYSRQDGCPSCTAHPKAVCDRGESGNRAAETRSPGARTAKAGLGPLPAGLHDRPYGALAQVLVKSDRPWPKRRDTLQILARQYQSPPGEALLHFCEHVANAQQKCRASKI